MLFLRWDNKLYDDDDDPLCFIVNKYGKIALKPLKNTFIDCYSGEDIDRAKIQLHMAIETMSLPDNATMCRLDAMVKIDRCMKPMIYSCLLHSLMTVWIRERQNISTVWPTCRKRRLSGYRLHLAGSLFAVNCNPWGRMNESWWLRWMVSADSWI